MPPTASPNFIIAGVNKAGTTSLFTHLAMHPDVCASDVKEVLYFLPLRYGEPLGAWEEYLGHWPKYTDQPVVMEASPGYFYGGRRLATAIDERLPDCKVMVVLRDPVDRARSFFEFQKSRLTLPHDLSFEQYVQTAGGMSDAELAGRRANPWYGIRGGEYARLLPDWMEVFGPRLTIRFFDDLRADGHQFVVRTLADLGLDPSLLPGGTPARENTTTGFRYRRVQRLALTVNDRTEVWWRRHPEAKRRARALYRRINASHEHGSLPDETADALRAHYAESNTRTAELLRSTGVRDLPPWLQVDALRD